jgi:hypothetical protein
MNDRSVHDVQAMVPRPEHPGPDALFGDLLDHLVRTSSLSHREAQQVVVEVLAYFNEPLEVFVRRRHSELQQKGLANPAIFAEIAGELTWWRLAAPAVSERQIRRMIYG